jgi:hypothetical protein
MLARKLLKELKLINSSHNLCLPAIVVSEPSCPIDQFYVILTDELQRINPSIVHLTLWPAYNMKLDDVKFMLTFFADHLQKSAVLVLDFTECKDEWIQSFYDHVTACYQSLSQKMNIMVNPPRNSLEGWNDKFKELKFPPVVRGNGAYVSAYLKMFQRAQKVNDDVNTENANQASLFPPI